MIRRDTLKYFVAQKQHIYLIFDLLKIQGHETFGAFTFLKISKK